jgi:hypothetical protein
MQEYTVFRLTESEIDQALHRISTHTTAMMMKTAFVIAALFASAQAFAPMIITSHNTALFNSETHIDKSYTAGSGMNDDTLPFMIKNLSKDNFVESLEMMEPLLLNECVGEECELYMSQLQDKAAELGLKIPEGYAPTHH